MVFKNPYKLQIAVGLVLLSFIVGALLYSSLPEKVPSHWNQYGEVDSYMPRFWGTFLFPLINLGLVGLFLAIPKIAVYQKNIDKFRNYYESFIPIFVGFMTYIYLATLYANFAEASMNALLAPAFIVLFYYVGVMTEHAKRNYFIGIRTPWTLASEKVWDKTHALFGKGFKIFGFLIAGAFLIPDLFWLFFLVPIVVLVGGAFVYSYLEYKKEKQ